MIKGKLFEASTASSQINVPRFKQSFLFLEEDVVKKRVVINHFGSMVE